MRGRNKINDTKKLTLNNWKSKGLKKLWVFFIIETKYLKDIDTSIVEEVDGIKIYIKTIKNLIGDISKLDKEKSQGGFNFYIYKKMSADQNSIVG